MSMQHENGQTSTGQAPGESFAAPNSILNCIAHIGEASGFCDNPEEYVWEHIGKQDMLVPYSGNAPPARAASQPRQAARRRFDDCRWEQHRVWVIEGTLRPGESNLLARRRFYIDENSWDILLGEGYDAGGKLTKCYMCYSSIYSGATRKGQWYAI